MKYPRLLASSFVFVAAVASIAFVKTVDAATTTWIGGGGNANWSNPGNWAGGLVPTTTDVAVFDSSCSPNCSSTIDTAINVQGIDIENGYAGTITQASGSSITIGSSGFVMEGPNHGAIQGTASGTSGFYVGGHLGPYALYFNGGNNYVATARLLTGPQKYSLAFWLNTTTTLGGLLMGFGNVQTGTSTVFDRQIYMATSGAVFFSNYNSGYKVVSSTATLNDGNWHFVVGTLDTSGGQNLYIDGALAASSTNNAARSTNGNWRLGFDSLSGVPNAPTSYYFNGSLDDIRIYNRALSASQVLNLYNNSTTLNGLQDYWGVDEGSGNTAYDTAGDPVFIGSSNANDTITVDGSFTQSGGTFTSTAGNLIISRNLTLSGGAFYHHNGIVTIVGGPSQDTTISCNGSPFNQITLSKTYVWGGTGVTIGSGCTIPLGTNPTSTLTAPFINYGTIIIASGTWNAVYLGRGYGTANLQNYGTIIHNGTGWVSHFGLVMATSTAVVTYNGTAAEFDADLDIRLGSFPSGLTITSGGGPYQASTISCNGNPFALVVFAKTYGGLGFDPVTIGSGCTIPLGTNPTTTVGGVFTNYGTITIASGMWTEQNLSFNSMNFDLQNYGTIVHNGTGWISHDGLVMATSTAVVTYNGTAAQFGVDLDIRLGSFPSGLTVTIAGDLDQFSTISCNGSPFSQVIISKTSGGHSAAGVTVGSGCTIPLGTNPTSTVGGTFTNYGTITIASGTWNEVTLVEHSGIASNFINYGTITHGGTGWFFSGDGLVMATSAAAVTYNGTAAKFDGDLDIRLGSFPTGLTITLGGGYGVPSTISCNGNPFNQIIFAKTNGAWSISPATIGSGCTVPLGTNPTSTVGGTFTNYGTITIASGTWNVVNLTNGNYADNLLNYGTIVHNGSGWVSQFNLVMATSTAVVTYNGTTASFAASLNTTSGTFPNGVAVTFTTGLTDSTSTCGSVVFGGLTVNKGTRTFRLGGPCTDSGDFNFLSGTVSNPASAYTLTVQGNYSQSSGNAFGGGNLTISFTGGTTSTITKTAGTFSSKLVVAKTGSTPVQLASDFTVPTQSITVQSGTFDLNNYNFTSGGALTVQSGGWLNDVYDPLRNPSTITIGATTTNNGMVFLDGSLGASCVSVSTSSYINIRSATPGTGQSWFGSGRFTMRYVDVKDQTGTASITVRNGKDSGGNGANWTFEDGPQTQLVQGFSNSIEGATQLVLTPDFWPKAWDLIIVAASARGQYIIAPTDNAGNTYLLAKSLTFGSSPSYALNIYYAAKVNSVPNFAITIGGTSGAPGTLLSGAAFEYTGVDVSSTLDRAVSNIDTSSDAISLSSGSSSGSTANELYFGALTFDAQTTATGGGNGWTTEAGIPTNDSTHQALYVEDQGATTTLTNMAATWSANASTSYGAALAIFATQPGGTGGGGNYNTSGTLDSATFDTGVASGSQLNSVVWQGVQPAGTTVGFQFALSNSPSGPWNFVGPGGVSSAYFTRGPGAPITLDLPPGYRYFRYRVVLFADPTKTFTPVVNDVSVNWSP
jgi:hypothetical protein